MFMTSQSSFWLMLVTRRPVCNNSFQNCYFSARTGCGFSDCFVGVCCDMCDCWPGVGWDVCGCLLRVCCVMCDCLLRVWCDMCDCLIGVCGDVWGLAWCLLRFVWLFAWCVLRHVSFGLEFAEFCLEPLFLNSGKALHLWHYQVLGTVLIPKQDKWNCWIAQLGLQHLTVSSSVSCLQ